MRRRARLQSRTTSRQSIVEALETRILPATIYVNSLADNTVAGDGQTTLREAVNAASEDRFTNDTIRFQSGLSGTIRLTDGPLTLVGSVNVLGNGRDATVIDGGGSDQIFEFVRGGSSSLSALENLTIQNASGQSGGALGVVGDSQTLEVEGVRFLNNSGISGGVIRVTGVQAGEGGPGIVTFKDTVFEGNSASTDGGAISVVGRGLVTLKSSAFVNNSANDEGGAIFVFVDAPTDSDFVSVNGGITAEDTLFDGNTATRGGAISSGSDVELVGSRITNNQATENGGGIYVDTNFNRSGALNPDTGELFVSGSTIDGNTAGNRGGGIFVETQLDFVSLTNNTISGNSALAGGGLFYSGDGTVLNPGRFERKGFLLMANNTVVENSSTNGGGLFIQGVDDPDVQLFTNIIAQNTAASAADMRISLSSRSFLEFEHNVVGDNSGTGFLPTGPNDMDGGDNLVGSKSAPVDPLLGPLTSFGTIAAHVPLEGSPVIDRGILRVQLEKDQLGNDRIIDGLVDTGAVEGTSGLSANTNDDIQLINGVLVVEGSNSANVITIDRMGSFIEVQLDDSFARFPADDVLSGRVKGNRGNDRIEVRTLTQRMLLDGNAGNDTIIAGPGSDTVLGGSGRDDIRGGLGDDSMHGGSGNDLIRGDRGNDTINGAEGNDTILGGDSNDTLFGGGGHDVINGEASRDSIRGGDGNDRLEGGDERDTIWGEKGNDTLIGGAGSDSMIGNQGRDTLVGEAGNDTLLGGSGNDRLTGGNGADVMRGSSGNDTLLGGTGADVLVGDDGKDLLEGNAGRDILLGGAGSDSLFAGAGDDLIISGRLLRATLVLPDFLTGGIRDEWLSGRSYDQRAINIRNGDGRSADRANVNFLISHGGLDRNVFDDSRRDSIRGGSGLDFFYATLGNDLSDRTAAERFDEL